MAVEPTGPESKALMHVRTMVSYCQAWQDWCGVDNQADALARIFYGSTKGQSMTHPIAFVNFVPGGMEGQATAQGGNTSFGGGLSGSISLIFEALPGEGLTDEDEITLDFMNKMGEIILDMMGLSGTYSDGVSFLNMVGWSRESGPKLVNYQGNESSVDYLQAEYKINWF